MTTMTTARRLVVPLALLLAGASARPALAQSSLCKTFEYPGSVKGTTIPYGINNAGDIVGFYMSSIDPDGGPGNVYHGFLRTRDGQFSSIDYPGAAQTMAHGINDAGQIVGFTSAPGSAHGFLLTNGQFSDIFAPGGNSVVTEANAINNHGDVAGSYNGTPDLREHGYAIVGGQFTTIDVPGIRFNGAWGINDAGVVTGWGADGFSGASWKWGGGQLTVLGDFPGSTPHTDSAYDINNAGKIVGTYQGSDGGSSFVWAAGRYSRFNCPDAAGTEALAINDKGSIAGRYASPDGNGSISFVTPPIAVVDPVPDLLRGPRVTDLPEDLATGGRDVQGIAADGVSQVVLRIPAANAGDELTLAVLNDQDPPAESADTVADGAVGIPGASATRSQVTVTAKSTARGVFAFAVYRAPADFPRTSGHDDARTTRDVSLRIRSSSTGEATVPLKIVRPPVLMIHGLWSNKASWDRFAPLVRGPDSVDPRFSVLRVDYSFPVGGLLGFTTPTYPANMLRSVRANSLGFRFNATVVSSLLVPWLEDFKSARNPAGISVAAVQVDVVGHSMGGNIARTMTVLPTYRGANTFGQGAIHKVITIDTPHLGSQLATRLLSRTEPTQCLRLRLAEFGDSFTYESLAVQGVLGSVSGAVADLVDSPLSGALKETANSTAPVPIAMLGAVYSAFGSLDCTFCAANAVRRICGQEPLAQQLTGARWPDVFGRAPNDAIVSSASQHNGGTGKDFPELLHSSGVRSLGFTGPSVVEDLGVGQFVIGLLNTPSTDRSWFVMVP